VSDGKGDGGFQHHKLEKKSMERWGKVEGGCKGGTTSEGGEFKDREQQHKKDRRKIREKHNRGRGESARNVFFKGNNI